MAKKKEVSKTILDLKREITESKIIIGKEVVLKNLRDGKLSKVYLAGNCSEKIKVDIEYYSGLTKVPVVLLGMDNEELGVFCKKHYFISVLGVKK